MEPKGTEIPMKLVVWAEAEVTRASDEPSQELSEPRE